MSRLRAIRTARGLTQTELAETLGCKQHTISELETGEKTPSLSLAARIETWSDGAIVASSWVSEGGRQCA